MYLIGYAIYYAMLGYLVLTVRKIYTLDMNNARCQINTSIKQQLKLRVEELQQKNITIEAILEAGVMVFEKKIQTGNKKALTGKGQG